MDQKKLALWLRAILAGVVLCSLVVYFVLVPLWGVRVAARHPEIDSGFWPGIVFIWCTAAPCYLCAFWGWRIISEIRRDNSFSHINAVYLRRIMKALLFDAAFFFAGNVVMVLLDWSELSVFVTAVLVCFLVVAVATAAAALSHLVEKAALLREENESII